jgi:hypothetical protein
MIIGKATKDTTKVMTPTTPSPVNSKAECAWIQVFICSVDTHDAFECSKTLPERLQAVF